jgi:hypothetical protein
MDALNISPCFSEKHGTNASLRLAQKNWIIPYLA